MHASVISLQQLLRLSFANSVTWLLEYPEGDVPVRWVVSSLDEIGPGDVLLIPGNELTPEKVELIWKRGGTAVISLGEAVLGDSTFSTDIPVVAIPQDQDIRTVNRTLLTILINQRAYLMERGVRVHAQLSQLEAEGEGITGLAQAMSEISGRGVLIQDKRLRILGECASSTLNSIWSDILGYLTEPENLPASLRDRKEAGRNIAIVSQSIPGGIARNIIPIVVGEVARGYLSLVGLEGEFDDLDNIVVEQGAIVCAVEMARTKAVREAEKRLKGDLLSAVLSEDLTPRDTHLWVQNMGLDLTQSQAVLRFSWDSDSPPSLRRLETLVNGGVASLGVKVILEAVGSEVVCVCQTKGAALALAEAVLDHAVEEFPDIPARCGIGAPVDDLSQWRDSFRQAGQALEMARRLKQRKPLYFPDLSVYRLLLQLEYHPELQTFKQEILGPLLMHDGSAEFLRTLEAYFDNNGNLSQAAEALFIHRNTLIYRMDRIAEISGLDLDHTETRLAIQLALRIHRMIDRDYSLKTDD
jgi:purine catabolism regulator